MNFWLDVGTGASLQACTAAEFVQYWSARYYDYTDVTDRLYWYARSLISSATAPGKGLELIGAWKTNALSRNGSGSLAFECTCGGQYFFTNMWKPCTSAGYAVWQQLWQEAQPFMSQLATEPQASRAVGKAAVDKWAQSTYPFANDPQRRFGWAFAITALHALTGDRYPIWDSFAQRGLNALQLTAPPHPLITKTSLVLKGERDEGSH